MTRLPVADNRRARFAVGLPAVFSARQANTSGTQEQTVKRIIVASTLAALPTAACGGDGSTSAPTQSSTLDRTPVVIPETPSLEPTAIPAPKAGFSEHDGAFTYKTTNCEILRVPQIPGLAGTLVEERGVFALHYLATLDNPYGLSSGIFAGSYYPAVYLITGDTKAESEMIGGVVLRAEVVRYYLLQASSPSQRAIVPLPFDPTMKKNSADDRVFIETRLAVNNGSSRLFLEIPTGSRLVVPFERNAGSTTDVMISQQNWGTVVTFGKPADLLSQFALKIESAERIANANGNWKLGDEVGIVDVVQFSENLVRSYDAFLTRPITTHPNAIMYGQSYAQDNSGTFAWLGLSTENILQISNNVVFIASNQSLPLR